MNLAGAVAGVVLAIATQNIRVGLPPPDVRHDLNQAAARSSVVFTQEMGYRDAAAFRPSGWGSDHVHGRTRGDCATYWDRSRWHLVRWHLVHTFTGTYRGGNRWAQVTILKGTGGVLAAVCVHNVTHARLHPAVEREGVSRLRQTLSSLSTRYANVVVGGDWNRGWGIRPRFKGFTTVRPDQPTHKSGATIDYLYWHHPPVRFMSVRVLRPTFSDHRGVRYRLRLGG